ncbi:unnamed protein product [Arabidopsis thaliana]|uniref:(thale cress) hypothetical protein n=1 Tax=Arabidopsis thaliana TaxID=3702 RepID=A0A7G2E817_ARATH|nr:unnamed protein product [Arabidopsis thaliana]
MRTILFFPGMDVSMSKATFNSLLNVCLPLILRWSKNRKEAQRKTFDLIQEISQSEDKEGYKNFYYNYGRFLKWGCIEEDIDNHRLIMPLLRFFFSKSEELTSLDEYIDHMGESQTSIYYLLKSDYSYFLEKVPQTTKVLYLVDSTDKMSFINYKAIEENLLLISEKFDQLRQQ